MSTVEAAPALASRTVAEIAAALPGAPRCFVAISSISAAAVARTWPMPQPVAAPT